MVRYRPFKVYPVPPDAYMVAERNGDELRLLGWSWELDGAIEIARRHGFGARIFQQVGGDLREVSWTF